MQLEPLEVKSDPRGALVEMFKLPNDGQVMYIVSKPNEMRGNHYHTRKTENFLVVWGSAVFTVKDRLDGDIMKAEVTAEGPISIKVIPNHTHNIIASDEGCICLIWVSEVFNPDDPDTFPEEI